MSNRPSSNPPPNTPAGTLQVVATPIGNLQDMSPRALAVLGSVDLIAAEDTRHTRRLLSHFGLKTPLLAMHDHNESSAAAGVIERIQCGASVALVSDAGTPLISDPGYRLINAAIAAGIEVVAVAGPSAVTAALSVAGLPTDRFVFEGFLPASQARRAEALARLNAEPRTIVLFASVHQIRDLLTELAAELGAERPAAVCRELTKRHETVHRGTLGELSATEVTAKGEFVVVIGGATAPEPDAQQADQMLEILLRELSTRSAAKVASELTGQPRNSLYQRALALKKRD